jgi:hypothetical protein
MVNLARKPPWSVLLQIHFSKPPPLLHRPFIDYQDVFIAALEAFTMAKTIFASYIY